MRRRSQCVPPVRRRSRRRSPIWSIVARLPQPRRDVETAAESEALHSVTAGAEHGRDRGPTWFPGATRVLGESAAPSSAAAGRSRTTRRRAARRGRHRRLPLAPRLAALHCGWTAGACGSSSTCRWSSAAARCEPARRLGDEPRPHDPDRARRLRARHRPLVRRALPRHRRPVPLDRGQHGRPAQADARRLVRQPAPAVRPRLPRGIGAPTATCTCRATTTATPGGGFRDRPGPATCDDRAAPQLHRRRAGRRRRAPSSAPSTAARAAATGRTGA